MGCDGQRSRMAIKRGSSSVFIAVIIIFVFVGLVIASVGFGIVGLRPFASYLIVQPTGDAPADTAEPKKTPAAVALGKQEGWAGNG